MPSKVPTASMFLLFAAALLPGQIDGGATQRIWGLDNDAALLRVYTPTGIQVGTVTIPGMGPVRGFAFDRTGAVLVCRGDRVERLARDGTPMGMPLLPPPGVFDAQDVIQTTAGDIIVAFGSTSTGSAIVRYDSAGTLVSTLTFAALLQPRRLAARADPGSTIVYVADSTGRVVYSLDYSVAFPVLSQVVVLTSQNIAPIGMCYDATHDDLWVSSEYNSFANEIGCIDLSTGTYSTAINYPPAGAPGLRAPSGLFYDRFRQLYIAGRGRNSGTAGIYVYDAPTPMTAPTLSSIFPTGGPLPLSIVDVELQPSLMTTCAPTEALGMGNTRSILELGANNRVTFSSSETPGAAYAAAISLRWQASPCSALFIPGVTVIPLGANDPRGLPFASDNLFWGSVGVGVPGPSPVTPPIDPMTMMPFVNNLSPFGVDITGFLGNLDASGFRAAFIDLTGFTDPGNALSTDGIELSLAWITFDPLSPSGFGFVSKPLCVTLRNPVAFPVTAIPCP